MTATLVDFSAQFGGRDAATAVLPHFHSLKAASRGLVLSGFPLAKLAYILRVDGEVNRYGLSGAGNLEVDTDEGCLSIDIGILLGDRLQISEVICRAILSSIEQIMTLSETESWDVDAQTLETCLLALIRRYRWEILARCTT